MNRTAMNLQDLFLNQVRKENVPVTIYLGYRFLSVTAEGSGLKIQLGLHLC